MHLILGFLAIVIIEGLIMSFIENFWFLFLIPLIILIFWKIYEHQYFKSRKFLRMKKRIQSYINDCNELNRHIAELKDISIGKSQTETAKVEYYDTSKWNVKRPELKKQKYAHNVHNCSRTVCDGARRDPFKYICKYFGVSADEETLEKFESILNNFEAAEDGKTALKTEKDKILRKIQKDVPALIRQFSAMKLEKNLGFEEIDLSTAHYPKYTFQYISPGGNTSTKCDIVMDIENLNRFVVYLSEKIKFRKSAAGQRALMTSKLRQKIKERDNFTCQQCGISVEQEPHLLLEIDHIIPISKGGMTTESNLQTLCWRCNRSKSNKI